MTDNSNKKTDFEYFAKRTIGEMLVSKQFNHPQEVEPTPMRIVSQVELEDSAEIAYEKKEKIFKVGKSSKVQWKAVLVETNRNRVWVTLQRYEAKTGKPHRNFHFSFSPEELTEFLKFVQAVKTFPLRTTKTQFYKKEQIEAFLSGNEDWYEHEVLYAIFQDAHDLLEEFLKHRFTKSEIVAFGYRKKQLRVFEKLLYDANYFTKVRQKLGKSQPAGAERVWQLFFEQNQWIFGYGLNYIFTSGFDEEKLEQTTSGVDFMSFGKRVDALMKTRGAISSLCFAEIKTPTTRLLMDKPYRPECWQISFELSGAIAQVQKTVQKAVHDVTTKFTARVDTVDDYGAHTGETAYVYLPKSFVVIGNLNQFKPSNNVTNEFQYGSFELFRQNQNNPEIITFDELYERAKYIVAQAEEYALMPETDIFDIEEDIVQLYPDDEF